MSKKEQPTGPTEERETPVDEHGAPEPAADASLSEQLEATRAERDENHNKWLRSEAELENFRKRVRKEVEDLQKFQALGITRDLLPGLDNLNRAIAAAESTGDVDNLLQGIRMVSQQIREAFTKHGVEPIAAEGQPFDPNLHEALQQVPTDEHPPMTVLQEVETGYRLHDRVIRPTKVIVSTAMPAAEE